VPDAVDRGVEGPCITGQDAFIAGAAGHIDESKPSVFANGPSFQRVRDLGRNLYTEYGSAARAAARRRLSCEMLCRWKVLCEEDRAVVSCSEAIFYNLRRYIARGAMEQGHQFRSAALGLQSVNGRANGPIGYSRGSSDRSQRYS
jgi:hypothetical protein